MANIAAQRIKREFKEVVKSEEVRELTIILVIAGGCHVCCSKW